MLGKLLLLALAIWMVVLLLKQYRRGIEPAKPPKPLEAQDMVSCKECGVHLPKSESILKQGAYFCCKEHSEKSGQ